MRTKFPNCGWITPAAWKEPKPSFWERVFIRRYIITIISARTHTHKINNIWMHLANDFNELYNAVGYTIRWSERLKVVPVLFRSNPMHCTIFYFMFFHAQSSAQQLHFNSLAIPIEIPRQSKNRKTSERALFDCLQLMRSAIAKKTFIINPWLFVGFDRIFLGSAFKP